MQLTLKITALIFLVSLSSACSPAGPEPGNTEEMATVPSPASAEQITEQLLTQAESEAAAQCRLAVDGMLEVTLQAINDTRSRPERREARRALYDEWTTRYSAGEDPCLIYADIGRAATTF